MPAQTKEFFEFGPYRIEKTERLLMRGTQAVFLPPKAVELLLVLLESSGHVVTKEELMQRVWANTFVQEVNLSRNIFHLRKALEETDGAKFIETIPRRGYRFVAPVKQTYDDGVSVMAHERSSSRIVVQEEIEIDAPRRDVVTKDVGTGQTRPAWLAVVIAAPIVLLGLVLATGIWYSHRFARSAASAPPSFQAMQIRRLTDSGKVRCPALSPDGKMLAYVLNDNNVASIRMRNIETGSEIQVAKPTATSLDGLMFSPDGGHLFYQAGEQGRGMIYRIPVFGGSPSKVASDVPSHFDISPDGNQLAFIRHKAEKAEDVLTVCDVNGANERTIKARSGRYYYNTWGVAPAWSPDGKTLVASAGEYKSEEKKDDDRIQYYVAVRIADGAETSIQSPKWHAVDRVSWLADGTGLIVLVQEKPSAPFQIWRLEYPGGAAQRITNDLQNYIWMSLTADTTLMAVMQDAVFCNIFVGPSDNPTNARQLAFAPNSKDGFYGLTWTSDGRIVYAATEGERSNLWIMNADGSKPEQLTFDDEFSNTHPTITPDGRQVLFISDRNDDRQIWKINIDGSRLEQVTKGERVFWMSLSPDGRWLLVSKGSHPFLSGSLWKLPFADASGPAVKITDLAATKPVVSPDGNHVAFGFYDQEEKTKSPWKIGVLPMNGGGPLRKFDVAAFRQIVQWAPDSKGFIYIQNTINVSNVWLQPIDGRPAKQISDFKTERLVNLAWSPDGKQLALARGGYTNDAFLVSHFR